MRIPSVSNGRVGLNDGNEVNYTRIGQGQRIIVMIPGTGSGLRKVGLLTLSKVTLYRGLSADYTVYVIGRRSDMPQHFSTRQMAQDVSQVMQLLGIDTACVLGVSMGGMIAQWLAIDYPEKVEKLILTVTMCKQNAVVQEVVGNCIEMVLRGDFYGVITYAAKKFYSPARIKRMGWLYALVGMVGKPAGFDKSSEVRGLLTEAESVLSHDASAELGRIRCPVLVIGGKEDHIVTGEASEEIHERIPGSVLYMYDGLGHGLVDEDKDFMIRVQRFFG